MKFIYKLVDKISIISVFFSASCIILLTFLILTEVLLRQFFNMSTMIADEYSGYLFLSSILFGLPFAFNNNAHIRINILSSRMSLKSNKIIDLSVGLITLIILIFLFYRSLLFVNDSYIMEMVSESISETPLYLTQLPMPIGIFIFILSVLVFILKRLKNDK